MSGDELRERLTAILWDEDHRVPSKNESAWGRYQRLVDALLNEDSPLYEFSLDVEWAHERSWRENER